MSRPAATPGYASLTVPAQRSSMAQASYRRASGCSVVEVQAAIHLDAARCPLNSVPPLPQPCRPAAVRHEAVVDHRRASLPGAGTVCLCLEYLRGAGNG